MNISKTTFSKIEFIDRIKQNIKKDQIQFCNICILMRNKNPYFGRLSRKINKDDNE